MSWCVRACMTCALMRAVVRACACEFKPGCGCRNGYGGMDVGKGAGVGVSVGKGAGKSAGAVKGAGMGVGKGAGKDASASMLSG